MFRELSRKNNMLTAKECKDILTNETRGVLSVNGENGYPYGTVMNHFYDNVCDKIYFHCGNSGYRLDCIRNNDKVSFCVCDKGIKSDDDWAYTVRSVVVFGRIKIIDELDKIIDITTKLSHKFTNDEDYITEEIKNHAHRTLLLELTIDNICGKKVLEK